MVSTTIKYRFTLIVSWGGVEMIPAVFEWEILLYEIVQVVVAFIAVLLALKWKKTEFLAGLSFLFIYAILDMVDVFFFTITQGVYLDVAQFGFILLAIIFFIIGMYHSWSHQGVSYQRPPETREKSSSRNPIFSLLRKI
jgi:hypothetical protein